MQDERDLPPDLPPGPPSQPQTNGPQPDPAAFEPAPQPAPAAHELPDALRNWQVYEIDGQVAEARAPTDTPRPAADTLQIGDRQDDWIVATLEHRRQQVETGATAEYSVVVLNNGPLPATFRLQVEGWLAPRWASDAGAFAQIEPGRRATLTLSLTPPRLPDTEAGEHHFALAVRALEYPGRLARLGAVLAVLPYDALELRLVDAAGASVSWLRRTVTLPVALFNRGNRPVTATLVGSDPRQVATFDFGTLEAGVDSARLPLALHQAITLPMRVSVQHFPPFGWQPRVLPVQVEAWIDDRPAGRTRTQLAVRPLIGPLQAALAAGLAAAGTVGLTLLLALVYMLAQRSAAAPAPAATQSAAPPPVIVVTLNQPASAPVAADGQAGGQADGMAGPNADFTTSTAPDPGLPLVLPDQVSTPQDGSAPAAAPAAIPVVARAGGNASGTTSSANAPSAASAAGDTRTYGQMFQEVGQRYDLDWKMLAAQAYVESGFDSLALSDGGAMGLMQVVPDTWREWAPAAEVTDPFDSYSNVLVAAVYLDYLRTLFAGKGYPGQEWMLIAYNWGPDKLGDFLAAGGTWDTLPEVRRQYATEILRIAQTIP